MLFDNGQYEFAKVVRAYSADLYRFAYWLCRDRNLAEDLVQETFARGWAGWRGLRDTRVVKSWLFTILRNEHARLYERKQIEIADEQELDNLMVSYESNIHSRLEMREALQALPQGYREPLLLQVLGGFSCAEIATILSLNDAAVMTRLSRARQAMRKLLESEPKVMEQRL